MTQRALVTGADGFIGSHLTEMLVAKGYKVSALCQYNSFNDWGWLNDSGVLSDIDVLSGDVRDPHYCLEITRGVDIVFHLAALIAIPYSYVAPASYVDTNVSGTLNICHAARENGCSRVIQTSTSEVYGTAQYVPIDERHPLQKTGPHRLATQKAAFVGGHAVDQAENVGLRKQRQQLLDDSFRTRVGDQPIVNNCYSHSRTPSGLP